MSSKPHQSVRRGQPPAAVLLDLDGTLLDGSLLPSVIANVCEVVAASTDGLDADRLLEANRHTFQTAWPQLEQEWARGRLDSASVGLTLWRRSLEACGYHDEQLAQLALQTHQRLELDSYRLFDDVQGFLAGIGGSCRLSLVTNGASETQRAKLRVLGLERHLDAVVISGEVGVAKPDPGMFRLALDRLGVSASAAWHVGDRLETDVAGANAAGLVSVWLNRAGRALRSDEAEPDFEIRSLQELLHLFST